jgi:cytochrome c-type biogenesis protein CcmH/NrfF
MRSSVRAYSRRFFFLATILWAAAHGTDADTRVRQLCARFIAPCCWHENLNVHYSPLAEELRGEIRGRVRKGESDDEIQQDLVRRYTARILAEPEGEAGAWLWWTPWVFSGIGMLGVSWVIWHSARRLQPQRPAGPSIEIPDSEWE